MGSEVLNRSVPAVPRVFGHSARSGAAAGAVSTLIFVAIHQVLISNIWFSLLPMLIAGALCGLVVAWSYERLFEERSIGSWLRYNAAYLVLLLLLGGASVAVFEPVTTIAALVEANEPPGELIGQAMPMTVLFTLAGSVVIAALFGRNWPAFGAIAVTCVVLVVLLGLNVSVIGLVEIPRGSVSLVAELYALIVVLDGAYVATYVVLERRALAV